MKYLKLRLIVFIAALTAMAACSTDESDMECSSEGFIDATGVTGPETVLVNEPAVFNVSFKLFNDCGSFKGFSQNNVFPRAIRVTATYEGCTCTPITTTETEQYTFTSATPGTYVLQFFTGQNEFISKTIVVSEP